MSTLLHRIRAVSAAARETGALKPIDTNYVVLSQNEEASPPFMVYVLTNLARKEADKRRNDPTASASAKDNTFNPFLPYEPAMYVEDVGQHHVMLLNKFNVVDNHTLIVTKRFEHQSSLLTCSDMHAMWSCLSKLDALAFYNAGTIAGASQRHKHLQLVPTPLVPQSPADTPFEHAVLLDIPCGKPYKSPHLPYVHILMRMDDCASAAKGEHYQQAASTSMSRYVHLLDMMAQQISQPEQPPAVYAEDNAVEERQPFPYNLLITNRWMMMVPRRNECFEDVSVNSLGFAGCLLVKNEQMLEKVKKVGGMAVLKATTFPSTD
ncbi:phosphorylase [Gracilaria domingensis]|nr:phosphorylase [Gracilaria domingensis]